MENISIVHTWTKIFLLLAVLSTCGKNKQEAPKASQNFPLTLSDAQIRKCAKENTRRGGKDCVLEISNKKYSPRYLYLAYFSKLLKRRVILKAFFQDEKERTNTATYVVRPIVDERGHTIPDTESKKQAVNMVLKRMQ